MFNDTCACACAYVILLILTVNNNSVGNSIILSILWIPINLYNRTLVPKIQTFRNLNNFLMIKHVVNSR